MAKLREARRLTDHEAPHLEEALVCCDGREPLRELPQVCLEVVAVFKAMDLVVERPADVIDAGEDDGGEQVLLVVEVLVDGLLGHSGRSGDLVDTGPQIALTEEQLTGGAEDGAVLACRTAFRRPLGSFSRFLGGGGGPATLTLLARNCTGQFSSISPVERYRLVYIGGQVVRVRKEDP